VRVQLVGRGTHLDAVLESCRTRRGGAVLVGPAGIGKTRLLHEAIAQLTAIGWHAERFVASEATSDVPFGPLISMLPSGGGDRTQLHTSIRSQLRDRAQGRAVLVAVDDAHLLDPASMACIVDLVHHAEVTVILTARTDAMPPTDITRLWSSGAMARVELGLLDPAESDALAEALLGAPVAPALATELTRRADGVPLLLRELVHDARAMGAIERRAGVWQLVAPLRSGTRLRELVDARVRQLEPGMARLFELVTLGEPLRTDLLRGDELDSLDRLELQGLVNVERSGSDLLVRADHPVLGEALRAAVPTRRRVDVLRDLTDRTTAAGCARRGDALRVVSWARETGDASPPDVALQAGHEALAALDLDQAADLASQALAEHPFEGHLLLGEVRRLQARAVEAEASLSLAAKLATDDEQIVRIAMWRSTLMAHHAGQPDAAIGLLEQAAAEVAEPARALELTSEASFLAGLLGRFDEAVRTNRTILATPGLDEPTAWTARINLIYAQTMLGRLDGVDEQTDAARAVAGRIETVRPEGVDLLWALVAGVAVQRGDLVRGEQDLLGHIAECERRGAIFGLAATILVQLLLLRGAAEVASMAERALRDLDGSDPYAVRSIALACATLTHVALGDIDAARRSFDAIPESALDDVRAVAFIGRAGAAIVGLDDPDEGAHLAAARGRESIARLHISFGLLALYDAVLLGRPDLVVDDMHAAVVDRSAPMLTAMCEHASALHGRDAPGLHRVATRFASMGARRLAAIAFADAARVEPRPTEARRAAARSMLWARSTTPLLAPEVDVDGALSERELEVAIEGAAGRPSREIGERLYLSVRTVGNHLRHVYMKLGIAGRDELRGVLHPLP
jgi:DNA-binding CsgD family transcriptional regulator